MANRFRVSGTLASRLEESGISSDAVLRRAGLSFGLFKQSKIFLTTEEMFALHRAIHDVSGNPVIGLKLGSEERPGALQSDRYRRALQPFVSRGAGEASTCADHSRSKESFAIEGYSQGWSRSRTTGRQLYAGGSMRDIGRNRRRFLSWRSRMDQQNLPGIEPAGPEKGFREQREQVQFCLSSPCCCEAS